MGDIAGQAGIDQITLHGLLQRHHHRIVDQILVGLTQMLPPGGKVVAVFVVQFGNQAGQFFAHPLGVVVLVVGFKLIRVGGGIIVARPAAQSQVEIVAHHFGKAHGGGHVGQVDDHAGQVLLDLALQVGADLDGFIGIGGDQTQLHAVQAQFLQALLQISLGCFQIKGHKLTEGFRHTLSVRRGCDTVGDDANCGSCRAIQHIIAQFFPVDAVQKRLADVFIAQDGVRRIAAVPLQLIDIQFQVGHAQGIDLDQVGLAFVQRNEIAVHLHAIQLACFIQVQGGVLILDHLIHDLVKINVFRVPVIGILYIAPADFRSRPSIQDKGPGGQERIRIQSIALALFFGKRLGNGRIGSIGQLLREIGIGGFQGDFYHGIAQGFHAQLLHRQLTGSHSRPILDPGHR